MNQKISKNKTIYQIIVIMAIIIVAKGLYLCFHSETIWFQNYTPVNGNIALSSIAALTPVAVMFVLLAGFKKPAYISSMFALLVTLVMAIFVWGMPTRMAVSSTLLGMTIAVFPIMWTLSSAVWIFDMLVESGFFEIIKKSLKRVSNDRRIQTLLIGFGFTTLLESLAAFGAPIAIGISMLIGLGFPPLLAATITLLADTSPSAWGTQSMPIVVLNSVTGLDINTLGSMIGRQTPVISALFPAGLVILVSGWKGFKEVWPITMLVGVAYGVGAMLTANFMAPYTAGLSGSMAAIITTLVIMRYWQPKKVWCFPEDECIINPVSIYSGKTISFSKILQAWSPYVSLIAIIGLVNNTGLKEWLNSISTVSIKWSGLHNIIWKTTPVVSQPEAYSAIYEEPILAVGGTLVFFAGLLTIVLLRIPIVKAFRIYLNTVKKLVLPGITILCILGIAYLMNYSAMTYTIGLAFASSGFLFPFASAFLGMLGCTLAGSVAGSNALFGNLVVVAGEQIGIDPIFSAGTLCSGGTMGKAIAPQDLVIASAVLNMNGKEGELLRRVFGISLIYTFIIGVLAMLQYYVFPWMLP